MIECCTGNGRRGEREGREREREGKKERGKGGEKMVRECEREREGEGSTSCLILHSTEKRALRKELHSFPTKINVHLPLTYCYPGSKLLDRDAELLSFYYYSGTAAHTSKSYSRIPFRFSY